MPGSLRQIHRQSIAITTTISSFLAAVGVSGAGHGGHRSMTFLWNIITITGTWDIALYTIIDGIDVKIAELLGQAAAGIFRVPLDAAFASTRMAIPTPVKIIFTEAVAGTLTDSQTFMVCGD